jgi:uncharacterized protein (TIGR03083 family)
LTEPLLGSRVTDMVDVGSAYTEVQQRMSEVVAGLSADQLALSVPACPDWTVQDLVAHHTAVIAEIGTGVLRELGDLSRLLNQNSDAQVAADRDSMTARQVVERRGRSIERVLEEWADVTARILPMLRGEIPFPDSVGSVGGVIAVNDIVVHEGDLREAVGLARAPEVVATSLALAGYGFSLDYRLRGAGLPAIAFEYDGKQRSFGEGEPVAVLEAGRTTLVRMLASRLTREEIVDLPWRGDPTPYLALIPEYGPAHP